MFPRVFVARHTSVLRIYSWRCHQSEVHRRPLSGSTVGSRSRPRYGPPASISVPSSHSEGQNPLCLSLAKIGHFLARSWEWLAQWLRQPEMERALWILTWSLPAVEGVRFLHVLRNPMITPLHYLIHIQNSEYSRYHCICIIQGTKLYYIRSRC